MFKFVNADNTLKPAFAALFMGAVVALSLLWTQKGIHVSGFFALLCSDSSTQPGQSTDLFCSVRNLSEDRSWIYWMVGGIFGGAFLTSFLWSGKFNFILESGAGVSPLTRLTLAASGGLLVGGAAALADGCTSSIGLTGSALLSLGSFLFLAVFFIGGFAARIFFGRFWL